MSWEVLFFFAGLGCVVLSAFNLIAARRIASNNEEIVLEQRIKIESLERDLELSRELRKILALVGEAKAQPNDDPDRV